MTLKCLACVCLICQGVRREESVMSVWESQLCGYLSLSRQSDSTEKKSHVES